MFVEDKKQGEAKTVDPTRQVFLKAADYMEKNGWCQNRTKDEKGRVCLLGAFIYTGTISSEVSGLLQEAGVGVIWNDTPGRTKEEVIAFLRQIGNS